MTEKMQVARPDTGNEKREIAVYDDGKLEIAIQPTWDEAVAQTLTLDRIGRNIAVWWGDWLNYMEDLFGEKYAQLIPDTGWAEKTLMNWKYVCSRVSPDIRRLNILTFDHLSSVAKFEADEQDNWLNMAAEGGWSANRLRQVLKGPAKEKAPKLRKVLVCCPECENEFDFEVEV